MSDLALKIVDNCIDIGLNSSGTSMERDDGLESAVLISLFTDRRVSESEIPDGETSHRGWWADEFAEASGDMIGSRLWVYERSKLTTQTAAAIQVRAKQALQWMLDDGVASEIAVTTSLIDKAIKIEVQIRKPKQNSTNLFSIFWDGQSLKR